MLGRRLPRTTHRIMKTTRIVITAVLAIVPSLAPAQTSDCLPGPRLAVSRQGPNQLQLDVTGDPGINYAIERSGDLGQWTPVATNRSSSGLVSFTHPISSAEQQQFFRALRVNSADGLGGTFIFDGRTFVGWEGDTVGTFHIADCAIAGGSLVQPLAENMYLCTTRRYTNFILRLEFKLVGTSGLVNSGVQFRSERIAGTQDVSGYQADLGMVIGRSLRSIPPQQHACRRKPDGRDGCAQPRMIGMDMSYKPKERVCGSGSTVT